MEFTTASKFLPDAKFIYIDVTPEEISAVRGAKYVTKVEGISLLGTSSEVPALAEKRIMPEGVVVVETTPVATPAPAAPAAPAPATPEVPASTK